MKLQIAMAGFRHVHIFDLYDRVLKHPGIELVATCETEVEASLLPGRGMEPNYRSLEEMLGETPCDIVGLGDAYGRRGKQAIAALRAGKHVLADKPLCTSLAELDEICALAAQNNLQVGLMLDQRDHGNFRMLREVVLSGRIGEVQTMQLSGQHPLLWGKRPGWYFEPGLHGGTLNDIAIHSMDFVPWATGLEVSRISWARAWNAKANLVPDFKDCGQFALELSNGAGVLGDVSYLAPDRCGYTIPNYWRITVHGTKGLAETSCSAAGVVVADDGSEALELLPPAAGRPGGYLEDFLAGVAGRMPPGGLDTAACLAAARFALQLERSAAAQ